jgi:hypothetical protein
MAEATEKFETVERTVIEQEFVGVTLELTVKEARALQGLIGKVDAAQEFDSLYLALSRIFGYVGHIYAVVDRISGERVTSFTFKEVS